MSYEPLHHKYRPQTFSELVGQDAIATTLTNALTSGRIAPAYLFTGPRGTGKTSSARILAKSLNCLSTSQPTPIPCGKCDVCQGIVKGSSLDVIEIDAASNTGVDNIREIIERSQFAPVQCRHKLYLIDEVHMLSVAAFNALLKTLEEPPPRVVFVLATTDPQRVLPTIISRCQRFDFRRIPLQSMVIHLEKIADQEGIKIDSEALTLVAQIANGGLRDAESLLDQLSLLPTTITIEAVWNLVGAVPEQDLLKLLQGIRSGDAPAIIRHCRHLMNRGREPLIVLQNLAGFYLNLLLAKTAPQSPELVAVTSSTWQQLCDEAKHWDGQKILQGQQHLKQSEQQIKSSTQPRLWLEVVLLGLLPGAITPTSSSDYSPELKLNTSIKSQVFSQKSLSEQKQQVQIESPAPVKKVENTGNQPTAISAVESDISAFKSTIESVVEPDKSKPQPTVESENIAPQTNVESVVESEISTTNSTAQQETPATPKIPLEKIWQQVSDNVQSTMTKQLLENSCQLLDFADNGALVGVKSQGVLRLVKERKANIEEAFQLVCGHKVSVTLQVGTKLPESKTEVEQKIAQPKPAIKPEVSPQIAPQSESAKKTEVSPLIALQTEPTAKAEQFPVIAPQSEPKKQSEPPQPEPLAKSPPVPIQTREEEPEETDAESTITVVETPRLEVEEVEENEEEFSAAVQTLTDEFNGTIIDLDLKLDNSYSPVFQPEPQSNLPDVEEELQAQLLASSPEEELEDDMPF